MVGSTISHYKILEKLGEGGMGVVYKAEDTKLGRCVAMKFLPPHVGTDEEKKSRFIQEARAASVIDHPNIGAIYEINETPDGSMYIVMACYDVESLKDKIEKGPLEINQAIDYSLQIANGMVKAHERGIIHRDLKPGNVLITNDGIAKIIDFGLAKLSGGMQLTRSGTTLGTVAYMSPEQTRGENVDERSDIWSLGIMLFEMLTGKLPFRGEFDAAMVYSITNENPISVETFRTSIPFDLKLIIARALEKDVNNRYQRMEEIVADLKKLHLRNQTEIIATDDSSSDWNTVTKTIRYMAKKHTVSFIWIPAIILILFVVFFLAKSFLFKPPPSTLSKSIAVLPFINLGESEQVYFADGFAEEITEELSKLSQILVISRQSSGYFKNSKLQDSIIADQLGVRYLLKGELQLAVMRVKLKLSLFDSHSAREVWKKPYDFARGEIIDIKQDIIKEIVAQLDIEPSAVRPLSYKPSADVYNTYLQGLYHRDKLTKDENTLAITFFQEAIRKDTNFIPAYVALANTKIEHYRQAWDLSPQYLTDARKYCEKAIQADTNDHQALAQIGIITDLEGNPKASVDILQRSITKDKNNAIALTSIAWIYLFELGEPAKGVMYLKQLEEINPFDWLTAMNLGVAYAQMKNYPEAIKSFHRAVQLNPTNELPIYSLGYAYERIVQIDSAIYYYQTALKINSMNSKTYEALNSILLAINNYAKAESLMSQGVFLFQDDYNIFYGLGVANLLNNKKFEASKTFNDGLNIVESEIKKNPRNGDLYAIAGLFNARLANKSAALLAINKAVKLDSTNEEVIMKVTRAYAVLGQKSEVLEWYKRAKSMNPEYDAAYLRTAMDFEKYRNDPDLLSIARQ
ncbi:MAG: protein kinase [Ignavibacteriales bacterium]|nr:protein kinase [Ignavibacteriales bacterium]